MWGVGLKAVGRGPSQDFSTIQFGLENDYFLESIELYWKIGNIRWIDCTEFQKACLITCL